LIDKLDYYDLFGILVPGMLLSYAVPVLFPQVKTIMAVGFPAAIEVLVFTALAVFVGHIIQAIASAIEHPVLFRSWGGVPSDIALTAGLGDRYLSADAAARIDAKLRTKLGEKASSRSVFVGAITLANATPASRAQTFNSLYAYHRALLVTLAAAFVLLIASAGWGAAAHWSGGLLAVCIIALVSLLFLVFVRTRQRAFYYVREVLYVAERALDTATVNASSGPEPATRRKD
jgi:hypothetical protein